MHEQSKDNTTATLAEAILEKHTGFKSGFDSPYYDNIVAAINEALATTQQPAPILSSDWKERIGKMGIKLNDGAIEVHPTRIISFIEGLFSQQTTTKGGIK